MSTDKKIEKIVHEFHTNLVSFLDELVEQFPTETDIILARILIKDTIDPTKIINTFIRETKDLKEAVKNRDEEALLNTELSIFNATNVSKVNRLKVLWKSCALDDNDRKIIWKWFDTFLFLSGKYQELKLQKNEN